MAPRAGVRDQRIMFQAPTATEGDMGGADLDWEDMGPEMYAAVEKLPAREVMSVQRMEPRGIYQVTIPNRRDIAADWRIIWKTNGEKILVLRDLGDLGQRPMDRTLTVEEAGPEMAL